MISNISVKLLVLALIFLGIGVNSVFAFITASSTVKISGSTANGPTLTNSDTYGESIANFGDLNGDGVNDIVVGATGDDAGGASRGAVHIHFMNIDGSVDSTVEINDTTLNGPVLANLDRFGTSVANIGDLNGDGVQDLVVGATGDDGAGTDRGTVHILFMNTDGSVDSTVEINGSTLNGPVLADSDAYGASVVNIGDLNGDGVNDIAVGATGDDTGGDGWGAFYIHFMNTDGSIDSTVKISGTTPNGPTITENSSSYGLSIANLGDLDGDGVQDLAVGAQLNIVDGSYFRLVNIHFMNTDGSIDSTVEINETTVNGPEQRESFDHYGWEVSSVGDLDGDGVVDLAVGAWGDNAGGDDRGTVYIHFLNTDGSIDSTVEINDLTSNGPELANFDGFGYGMASLGDLNADGVGDLVVGAYNDDTGGSNRGAAYVVFLTETSFTLSGLDAGSISVTERGAPASFTARLGAKPTNNVVILVTSSDTTSLTVSPPGLTFTPGNYNTPQTITVTPVSDDDTDNETPIITLAIDDALSDDSYDPLSDQTVSVNVTDYNPPAVVASNRRANDGVIFCSETRTTFCHPLIVSVTDTITPPSTSTNLCSKVVETNMPIKFGVENNPLVVKAIQVLLNDKENAQLEVSGLFDELTETRVKEFQSKYALEILAPWGLDAPTGVVYTTTAAKMNALKCSEFLGCPVFNQLTKLGDTNATIPRIKNFLNFVLGTNLNVYSNLFDIPTAEAVKVFQTKYKDSVLRPWGLTNATGLWYQTTTHQANKFMGCSVDPIVLPNGTTVD